MASSWILKTRQMSEAGKEILLREALVNHMRSNRDRQLLMEIAEGPRPMEDILSFFASFWLYHYQGVKLIGFDEAQDLTIELKDEATREERRQLELEIRQLLGVKFQEEIDVSRLVSEFFINAVEKIGGKSATDQSTKNMAISLVKEYLGKIPTDYSPNHDIDFVNEVTGWGAAWRRELYAKASGLKETALSLRDELLRPRDEETAEITVLTRGLSQISGTAKYAEGRPMQSISDSTWNAIADAVLKRLGQSPMETQAIRAAHELKLDLVEAVEIDLETPTSLEEYEAKMGQVVGKHLSEMIKAEPDSIYNMLSQLLQINSSDIQAALRVKGIKDISQLADGLMSVAEPSTAKVESSSINKEDLEVMERSLRRLEKLETTLQKQVKGMMKAKGWRASEIDKISLDLLTKDRSTLMGIEVQVLETLESKMRVPSPEDLKLLIKQREQVHDGSLSSLGMASVSDISHQLRQEEVARAIKLDLVWHFTIGLLTNLTRIVETYMRSKQDMLRMKALLKSIYEDTETELQFLREEILIDLTAIRIYELKCVHPELDASTLSAWMHARLASRALDAASSNLESTPSPVFEGVVETPLVRDGLTFDNYAIAYDVMHRFLKQERSEKAAKEELAIDAKRQQQKLAERKKASLDALSFVYTKAHTVFRAIVRVGTAGLEWTANDDTKLANLLAFYVRTSRGRSVCTNCGAIPKEGVCSEHSSNYMIQCKDLDSLAVFVMRSISDIKRGLIGSKAEAMTWDEARVIVQREIGNLKRSGKLTSKTNLNAMLPGEINYIVGPALAKVIGQYFNNSLQYAARRANLAKSY